MVPPPSKKSAISPPTKAAAEHLAAGNIFDRRGLASLRLDGQAKPWTQPARTAGRSQTGLPSFRRSAGRDILWRIWKKINEDRILLVAAGATFYLLLALFPFLAAFVSLYGFVADPRTVADHISFLAGLMPSGGFDVIKDQLRALAAQDREALSVGFLLGLGVALWSANSGVKVLFDGLNVAYDENEKRGFIRLNLLSFAFTVGAILIGVAFIVSVGIVPAVLAFFNLGHWTELLVRWGRWPLMLAATAAGGHTDLPVRAKPRTGEAALADLGCRTGVRRLDRRLVGLLLLPAELCRLQRDLRHIGRRHRLHGLDLDFRHHPAWWRRTQRRDGTPDRKGFHHRAAKTDGATRRRHGRHAWQNGRR